MRMSANPNWQSLFDSRRARSSDEHGECEGTADDATPELALLAVFLIAMKRMLVHGEQREPDVVGLCDGAARLCS